MNCNTLIIDCSYGMHIGVLSAGQEFYYEDNSSKKQSTGLLEKIDELLKKANLKIKDINVIAVCVGPGSFTGIRVAVATAKGIAEGTGAKVVTFNSFETIKDLPQNNYAVVVEGFGDNHYYLMKKFGRQFWGCAQTQKIKELTKDLKIYTISALVNAVFAENNCQIAKYSATKIVTDKINSCKFIITNQISPLYLRASQAEIEREKHDNKL